MQTLLEILHTKKYETDKYTQHNYINCYYEDAFRPFRDKKIDLLEIGILKGESLKLWSDYFVNASNVVGIDLFGRVSFEHVSENLTNYNVTLHKLNSVSCSEMELNNFIVNYPEGFDIIIDDGVHEHNSQISTYNNFKSFMKNGGVYIIEDILGRAERSLENAKILFKEKIPNIEFIESRGQKFNALLGVIKF